MSVELREFILEAIVTRVSAREFAALSVPLDPCAVKVREIEVLLNDFTGRALRGKVLMSAAVRITGTYVDQVGDLRFFTQRESVSVLIMAPEVTEEMRVVSFGKVTDTVVELVSPCDLLVKATFDLDAWVTQCVIIKDSLCPSEVTIRGRDFFQAEEIMETADDFRFSLARDVSERSTLTYFVRNIGGKSAEIQLEVSPDTVHWQEDDVLKKLSSETNVLITPLHFMPFARLRFRSAVPGLPTRLRVWFQSQA